VNSELFAEFQRKNRLLFSPAYAKLAPFLAATNFFSGPEGTTEKHIIYKFQICLTAD
jgi:hypothetical protein